MLTALEKAVLFLVVIALAWKSILSFVGTLIGLAIVAGMVWWGADLWQKSFSARRNNGPSVAWIEVAVIGVLSLAAVALTVALLL